VACESVKPTELQEKRLTGTDSEMSSK